MLLNSYLLDELGYDCVVDASTETPEGWLVSHCLHARARLPNKHSLPPPVLPPGPHDALAPPTQREASCPRQVHQMFSYVVVAPLPTIKQLSVGEELFTWARTQNHCDFQWFSNVFPFPSAVRKMAWRSREVMS